MNDGSVYLLIKIGWASKLKVTKDETNHSYVSVTFAVILD